VIEKIAVSSAITMSQAAAMPVPPPKQPPWTSAIVGFGISVRSCTASVVRRETAMLSSGERLRSEAIQARSAPAWKCRPSPRITTTRTALSVARAAAPSVNSAIIWAS